MKRKWNWNPDAIQNVVIGILVMAIVGVLVLRFYMRTSPSMGMGRGVLIQAQKSKADGMAGYFDHVYLCESLADDIADAISDEFYGAPQSSGIRGSDGPALIKAWSEQGCGWDWIE